MSGCDNETHGHLIEAHDRLVQCINAVARGGDVSSYLLTVDEWHSIQALGERINHLQQIKAAALNVHRTDHRAINPETHEAEQCTCHDKLYDLLGSGAAPRL